MSKIEKALSRAREVEGDPHLLHAPGANAARTPGTAVVANRVASAETIPRMAKSEVRMLGPGDLLQRGIIQAQHGEDPAVQVFRDLRTKIIKQSQGRNAVILVASVTKGCGSSFIARNLAAAFAFDVCKTALLIDCNLRNPSVHKFLSNAEALGLTDYFESPELDIGDIVQPVGIARYRAITAGKRRETLEEHFSSVKMKRLMESARERYPDRFIILDGPPMSKIADIRILSDLVDYVLVVARYARSTNTQISSCLETIGEKKLLGIVFNEEPRIPRTR